MISTYSRFGRGSRRYTREGEERDGGEGERPARTDEWHGPWTRTLQGRTPPGDPIDRGSISPAGRMGYGPTELRLSAARLPSGARSGVRDREARWPSPPLWPSPPCGRRPPVSAGSHFPVGPGGAESPRREAAGLAVPGSGAARPGRVTPAGCHRERRRPKAGAGARRLAPGARRLAQMHGAAGRRIRRPGRAAVSARGSRRLRARARDVPLKSVTMRSASALASTSLPAAFSASTRARRLSWRARAMPVTFSTNALTSAEAVAALPAARRGAAPRRSRRPRPPRGRSRPAGTVPSSAARTLRSSLDHVLREPLLARTTPSAPTT
jgi:hypothetical protein